MPRHLNPKRSGVHRVACSALYRALLQQSSRLPLAEQQQSTLRHSIQSTFRKHADLQSPKRIKVALQAGYDALRLFERAMAGDALAGYARLVSRIGDMISALPPPPSSAPPPKVSELPKTPRGPRVWPIPGAVPVLSRPHPGPLSGRRQVPKLVNASGIPILRLKKPQSPYLSRIIRNKKEDFQKKVTQLIELQNHLEKVRLEDRWDLIVRDVCGRSEVDGDEENEPLWAFEVVLTMRDINRKLRKEKEARAQTAKKMYEIVVEERRLAEAEKLQRIREKKLARRLAKAEEAMQAASLG